MFSCASYSSTFQGHFVWYDFGEIFTRSLVSSWLAATGTVQAGATRRTGISKASTIPPRHQPAQASELVLFTRSAALASHGVVWRGVAWRVVRCATHFEGGEGGGLQAPAGSRPYGRGRGAGLSGLTDSSTATQCRAALIWLRTCRTRRDVPCSSTEQVRPSGVQDSCTHLSSYPGLLWVSCSCHMLAIDMNGFHCSCENRWTCTYSREIILLSRSQRANLGSRS